MRHFLLVVCSVAYGEFVWGGERMTVQSLVEAQQSAVGLIHSLDVELYFYEPGANAKPASQPTQVWRWSKQGQVERIRHRSLLVAPRPDGRPLNLTDVLFDGKEARVLYNWDPRHPQEITPAEQGTVEAWTEPQTRNVPGGCNPALFALHSFQLNPQDGRRTLGELVSESPEAVLLERRPAGDHGVWTIRVKHPGIDGEFVGSYIDIAIDRSVNFHVRRATTHVAGIKDAAGKPAGYEIVREVMRFRDFGNGVFFPEKVEMRVFPSSRSAEPMITPVTLKVLSLNTALSDDALGFAFPEHALVRHFPPQDGKVRVELWGPGNRPLKEVTKFEDLSSFLPSARASAQSRVAWKAVANIVILAIFIAGVVIYRRVRARGEFPQ